MKKFIIVPVFLIIVMTVLNISKIDTDVSAGNSLASIITSAKADGESEIWCYQQIDDLGLEWQDGCNWSHTWEFSCQVSPEGSYPCYFGTLTQRKIDCYYSQDDDREEDPNCIP